jgi:recombination protein RecA
MRLDIRRIAAIKNGDENVGNRTRVRVVKNKLAPPFRTAEFDIMFGVGVSKEGDVLDLSVDKGIVVKSGAWYSFGEERIGQGRENVKQFLKENPDIFREIEGRVRATLNNENQEPEDKEKKGKNIEKDETNIKAEAKAAVPR